MTQHSRFLKVLCVLALCAIGEAQAPAPAPQVPPSVRRGMMSTTPVGLLVSGSNQLLIAPPGQTAAAPFGWDQGGFGAPGSEYPQYTLAAIFHDALTPVVLSAISTGNDWMPLIDEDGTLIMTDVWFGLTVSVTNGSPGASNSHIARVQASMDSAGAELFTYYAIGSTGIDPSLVHTTVSERSREELGLTYPMATPPEERPEVTGLDHGLGVIPFDPDYRSGLMFGVRDRFYYALAPECLAFVPNPFAIDPSATPPNNWVAADACTVYVSYWTGDEQSGYAWGPPTVFRTCSALELTPGTDRIDALAVDANRNQVIFSTQLSPNRGQLMVHRFDAYGVPTGPAELKAADGYTVAEHLGLTEPSDVDGTCGIDPENILIASGSVGIPELAYTPPGTEPLGVSISRAKAGAVDQIHVHLSGVNVTGPGASVEVYFAKRLDAESHHPFAGPNWIQLFAEPVLPGSKDLAWTVPSPSPTLGEDIALMGVLWDPNPVGNAPVARGSWVSFLRL